VALPLAVRADDWLAGAGVLPGTALACRHPRPGRV